MEWSKYFPVGRQPTEKEVAAYIDSPLWDLFCQTVQNTYYIQPAMAYSCCSMAPGWNIKYKKGSKALCTCYPHKGYFTCLIVVGSKIAPQVEFLLPTCDPAVEQLYWATTATAGNRWLMVDVTTEPVLQSVIQLLQARVAPPKQK